MARAKSRLEPPHRRSRATSPVSVTGMIAPMAWRERMRTGVSENALQSLRERDREGRAQCAHARAAALDAEAEPAAPKGVPEPEASEACAL